MATAVLQGYLFQDLKMDGNDPLDLFKWSQGGAKRKKGPPEPANPL